MCNAIFRTAQKGQNMFAAIERFLALWLAPLANELARMPPSAQRDLLTGL